MTASSSEKGSSKHHRAEDFVRADPRIGGDAGEHGRRHEVSLADAAGVQRRSRGDGVLDPPDDTSCLDLVDEWADVRRRVLFAADDEGRGGAHDPLEYAGVERLLDEDSLHRKAILARDPERAVDHGAGDLARIGIRAGDQGVVPAQFHEEFPRWPALRDAVGGPGSTGPPVRPPACWSQPVLRAIAHQGDAPLRRDELRRLRSWWHVAVPRRMGIMFDHVIAGRRAPLPDSALRFPPSPAHARRRMEEARYRTGEWRSISTVSCQSLPPKLFVGVVHTAMIRSSRWRTSSTWAVRARDRDRPRSLIADLHNWAFDTLTDVTGATFIRVTEQKPGRWLDLVVRVPAEPSRHRVAVWRELRRIGALSLGQGTWAVPDVQGFADGVTRVIELAQCGEGEVVVLDATGRAEQDGARLEALFNADRQDEWTEFLADCGKFDAEIDKEIRDRKFTMAELEEEEQSLERLRRWHRDLKARDAFGAPSADATEKRLKHCTDRLADYTEQVFLALHQM
jgi:hypothetical protein